ncbi:hyalin-like [Acanthaster planci]|uniref:Hyalin-like n=1 Tax=Acanthaster planci TaxID=133434 RepID=A0A8B7XTN7_ACAPL|nr:hyalin-like [Acanthaster planci]
MGGGSTMTIRCTYSTHKHNGRSASLHKKRPTPYPRSQSPKYAPSNYSPADPYAQVNQTRPVNSGNYETSCLSSHVLESSLRDFYLHFFKVTASVETGMLWGKVTFSWALIALTMCLVFSSVESNGLSLNSCPTDITATRSELVYWSPPMVSTANSAGFTLVGTHQPGRYYYENTTVTYTAEDDAEVRMCTFDVIIEDDGSPVITSCPGDMTATAPAAATQVSVSWSAPTVQDSTNVQVSSTRSPGDQFSLGRNTVTYTFRYTNNDSAPMSFCRFDVFVQEGDSATTPTIDCPPNMMVTLEVGQESVPVTWDDPTYPTNLGSVTVACARSKSDLFFAGDNDINCVAYFESGEARMCDFTVTVTAAQDSQNPSIVDCPSNIVEYVAPNATGKIVTWPEPTIIDNNQQNLQLVSSHTNGIFYNVGTYDITYTGTDASNNAVTCHFRLSVRVDDAPPVINNCPSSPFVAYVQSGLTSGQVSWPQLTATDNADTNVQLDGPMGFANGGTMSINETRSVMYVATDDFNNTNICAFTVMLLVDQVPDYTVGCSSDTTYPTEMGVNYRNVTWPEPRVTDDLSQDSLILTKSHEPGMNYEIGVYIVEYTATDAVGNVGTCSFVITVADEEDPMLNSCRDSRSYTLSRTQSTVDVSWTNPPATDNSCLARSNCDTVLSVTSSSNPGPFGVGNHTVTITARDEAGNTDTCTFYINVMAYVRDTMKPEWANCPSSPVSGNTDSGQPTYTYSWVAPTVTDDRGIIVSQFASHSSPFAFPIGQTTVTYRATDAENNEGLCTFPVTVTDNQAPAFTPNTGCGSTITHYVRTGRTLTLAVPTPSATDNSGVAPTITNSITNQATYTFSAGSQMFEYTATDGAGKFDSDCQITVVLVEDSDPWSVRGSVTLTRIRGVAGQFSDASSTQLLAELTEDMDRLFRGSSIRSHFVGVDSLTHTFVGGNPRVTFRLYFNKGREGRHTSRQITEAFYAALSSSRSFATNNFVLSGSLDIHVREFKLTSTIIQLDNTPNPAFVSSYDEPKSSVYIGLENRINMAMDGVYGGDATYLVSVLVDFRDGSIINDVVLVYDNTSSATEANIVSQFNGQLASSGLLSGTGLYFSTIPTAQNQELCPTGECQNSGTCAVDTSYSNVCTCPDGYSGTNCETVDPTSVLSPAVIAAIIGGSILLLLLLFALLCCCIYFCREPYKDYGYPLERPFQIVDDKASVVSSVDVFMMPRERVPLALPPPPPLALPPPPPPKAPTLNLNDEYYPMEDELYGRRNEAFALDMYPSDGPSFSPDGEVYVTGPNQVAIRPRSKPRRNYHY